MEPFFSGLAHYVEVAFDWTEKHPGLSGWVGAVGSIIAILAAWYLARAEYQRTKRQAAARRRMAVDLILRVISDFEALVRSYTDMAIANDWMASSFYSRHLNDVEVHGMTDLAHLPIISWPSLETYASFRRYWSFSIQVLETSNTSPINKDDLGLKLKEHDLWLANVRRALLAERKYGQ
jgi:hypothetical protein